VRPKDAKIWFSVAPGTDGKIVYLEAPAEGHQKDGAKGGGEPGKAEAVAAAAL
jgi:hypothetical protein